MLSRNTVRKQSPNEFEYLEELFMHDLENLERQGHNGAEIGLFRVAVFLDPGQYENTVNAIIQRCFMNNNNSLNAS